jgi:hypothetical protein
VNEFKSGYLIEEEDHAFLESTSTPMLFSGPISQKVSFREKGLRIENQGRMGSCGGHAGSSVLECLNWLDTKDWVQLSRMWCYIAAQRETGHNGRDVGCTISGLAKAMQSRGVCLESSLPYPDRYSDVLPRSAAEEAAQHKIKAFTRLPTAEQARQFIGSGLGLIAIGIPWMNGFQGGEISSRTANGGSIGGHALAVTGYDDSTRTFEVPNSWGEQAGNQGWFRMTYEFWDKIFRGQNAEAIGFSDLEEFTQPRDFGGMA